MRDIKFACCVRVRDSETAMGYGYDFVELAGTELWQMTDKEYENLERCFKKKQILCCGCNAYCPPAVRIAGPGFDKTAAGQYAEKVIKRAAGLGARHVGIGSPMSRTLPAGYSWERAEQEMLDFLDVTAEAAQVHGAAVLIESLNPAECNFITSSHEAFRMFGKARRTNVGIVYDIYHALMSGEEPDVFRQIQPHVRHIHICGIDQGKRRFPERDDLARLKPYLDVIKSSGYEGIISVECEYEQMTQAKEALEILKGEMYED